MNHEQEHRLQLHVERIVRPIIARESDKLAMRQELFGHLTAAFEQEAALANDDDAFKRAAERLGESQLVRQELQQSVSLWSRVDSCVERFSRRPDGRSQIVHAARIGATVGAGGVSFLLILSAIPYLFGVEKCNGVVCTVETLVDVWPQMLGAGLRMFPFVFLATFNSTLLAIGLNQIVSTKSGTSVACLIVLRQTTLVLVVLFLQSAMLMGISSVGNAEHMASRFVDGLFWCCFFSTIAALALLPLSFLAARRQRAYAAWAELELEA